MRNKKIPNILLLFFIIWLMLLGFASQYSWIPFSAACVYLIFYRNKRSKSAREPLLYNPQKEILEKYLLLDSGKEKIVAELQKIPEMSPHPRNKVLESELSQEAKKFLERKSDAQGKNLLRNVQALTLALRTQHFEYAFKSELSALLENLYGQTENDSRWGCIHYAANARELDKEKWLLAQEVRFNPAKVSAYLRGKVERIEDIWLSGSSEEDYQISLGLEKVDPELAKIRLRAQLRTHGFISKNPTYNPAYERIADSLYRLESEVPSTPIGRLLNWSCLLDYGDSDSEYWQALQKPLLDLAISLPVSEKGVAHAIRQIAFYSKIGSDVSGKATEEFLNVLKKTSEIPALRSVEKGDGGYCLGTCEFTADEAKIVRLRNWKIAGDASHPTYLAAHEKYWQILDRLALENEEVAFSELGSALLTSYTSLREEIAQAFKALLPNRAIANDSKVIFYLHSMYFMQCNSDLERKKYIFIKDMLADLLEIVRQNWPEAMRPIQRHWSE